MNWLKRNWGWILVCIIASFPLIELYHLANFNFANNDYEFLMFDDYEYPEHIADQMDRDAIPGIEFAIHTTGEWAIRFLIAILMCTPIRILLGWTCSLHTRQTMGITTGVFASLHFSLFVSHEGFFSVFSELELVLGLIAGIIIFALMITSNKFSMRLLKRAWKKLHRLAYLAAILVVLHIILLKEDWLLYSSVLLFGFLLRYKPIKNQIEKWRIKKA